MSDCALHDPTYSPISEQDIEYLYELAETTIFAFDDLCKAFRIVKQNRESLDYAVQMASESAISLEDAAYSFRK